MLIVESLNGDQFYLLQ